MIQKEYQAGLCTAFCITFNCLLRFLCIQFDLPVRLDSFGTALAAYLLGPFSGLVVGAATGIVRGFHDTTVLWAVAPNALIGLMVGIFARKGYFRSFFDMMAACAATSALTAVVYTIINCNMYDGLSGNCWGMAFSKCCGNTAPPWRLPL